MRNRPAYTVESVDHALQLAMLLRQEGTVRVTDAAAALGVSRSTAHRLLQTLAYRDFAEQAPDRSYRPGSLLATGEHTSHPYAALRRVARPHLHELATATGESANVQVLGGENAHVVVYVEGAAWPSVGDRFTREWPARLTSGGRVLLAHLGAAELDATLPDVDDRLRGELELVRRRGYAVNDQLTEEGVTAVGVLVRAPGTMAPLAAIALAMPSERFDVQQLPGWVGSLTAASALITRDLAAEPDG
ncbi:IclR family transcriptional regulator [Knoellia remsis]|uniref:IclR family transcriptional regulator n=1 Tax=Knoellia remsis TaxID=407159 RepID=A0A2T0UQG1_9MICO|nr:IclR family transcriptional regulator C-terminal domain-containing protein [Knoellia remsis]PRY60160.1 IclR family transcriptional regulator [Knoellia remsis]